jgi:tRNA1(Val) A37 N6-methylase TrmN6
VDNGLETWIAAMASQLKRGGTMTLIVVASAVPACLDALRQCDCRCAAIHPFWPKLGRPAKLVLLRGVKSGRRPFTIHAGLVLHRDDGCFTPEADALLRDGAALAF